MYSNCIYIYCTKPCCQKGKKTKLSKLATSRVKENGDGGGRGIRRRGEEGYCWIFTGGGKRWRRKQKRKTLAKPFLKMNFNDNNKKKFNIFYIK